MTIRVLWALSLLALSNQLAAQEGAPFVQEASAGRDQAGVLASGRSFGRQGHPHDEPRRLSRRRRTRVTFAAFVLRADTSNQGSGEAVNCNKGPVARNDIHIHLGPSKSKEPSNLCNAVVAEIIPHLRPDAFTAGNLQLTNNILGLEHPVRITGQLFYDGNHPPKCTGDPPSFRAGKWEIHPVYSVEVCKHKSLTTCDARTDSEWKDLKAWLDEQQEGPDP